ncbi:hypothetical protein AGMMS50230_05640 [Spirochaetia bacterium]|nr:hypothetical protein AGMMS50230_05640 [Spirochaetia bacterium]
MKKCIFAVAAVFLHMVFTACTNSPGTSGLLNGYYTAEMEEFDSYGWKEYIAIYVNNGRIVTVEYNAKNASGFIKSWDSDYMRLMNITDGTYPNEYTRNYATALLQLQKTGGIDVLSGATNSYHTFILLANAVLEQARSGTRQIAFVPVPPDPHDRTGESSGTP